MTRPGGCRRGARRDHRHSALAPLAPSRRRSRGSLERCCVRLAGRVRPVGALSSPESHSPPSHSWWTDKRGPVTTFVLLQLAATLATRSSTIKRVAASLASGRVEAIEATPTEVASSGRRMQGTGDCSPARQRRSGGSRNGRLAPPRRLRLSGASAGTAAGGEARYEHAQTLALVPDERWLERVECEFGARSVDLPGCRHELLRVLQPRGCLRITAVGVGGSWTVRSGRSTESTSRLPMSSWSSFARSSRPIERASAEGSPLMCTIRTRSGRS